MPAVAEQAADTAVEQAADIEVAGIAVWQVLVPAVAEQAADTAVEQAADTAERLEPAELPEPVRDSNRDYADQGIRFHRFLKQCRSHCEDDCRSPWYHWYYDR